MAIKFLSGVNLSDVTAGSILKLDSNGNIVAATAGTDYATASVWTASGSNIYYSSGNVTIGASSNSAPLHVYAYQTTDPKILIEDGNTGDASMQFKISTQQYTMGIDNSDSDKFVLAASSALGTTNALEISTTGVAQFGNDIKLSNGWTLSTASTSYAAFSSWVNIQDTGFYTTSSLYMDLDDSSSRFVIRSENNTEEFIADTATDRFTIPNWDLKIEGGDLDLRDPNAEFATNVLYFNAYNGASTNDSNDIGTGIVWKPDYTGYSKRSAGIMQIAEGNYFKSGLAFYTNNTSNNSTDWSERMRLDMDGNLGIGTTNPGQRLEVNGNADVTGRLDVASDLRLRGNSSLLDQGVVRLYTNGNNHLYIDTGNDGNQVAKFDADGSLTLSSSNSQGLTVKQSANSGADMQVEIRGSRNAPAAGVNPAKLILSSFDNDDGSGVVKTGAEFYMESTSLTGANLTDFEAGIRYRKDGSVVDGLSIHDGQVTAHGDLLVNGGNIIMGSQYGVRFNDANTRIYTNTDNPEDLIVEADQNLHLNPDGSILAQSNLSMEGGSIITTDSNNTLVLSSNVQHDQGSGDAVISFKQSTTELGKFDQDGYMYAAGFKVGTGDGVLRADGSTETITFGTMASASTGDYKDSDAVESYVAAELLSYTPTTSFGSNAFTSYTDHSTQGYLTSSSTSLDSRYYTETELDGFFKSITHQGNYISTADWSLDGSGSVDNGWSAEGYPFSPTAAFSANGSASENTRILQELPNGAYGVVWRTPSNDATSDADGGWDMDIYNVHHSKAYRSIVMFQKTDDSTAGTFYHGCHGSHTLNTDGTANTNPYFHTVGFQSLVQGRWYVSVGYIQPYQYPSATQSSRSGIYDCYTGKKVVGGNDYMMKSGSTTQRHRTYQYYSTDTNSSINWWNPRFEEINGNEPSIAELIQKVSLDGELGLNFHSKFPAGALDSLTEATDATNDKILLWDESADVWKQMTLEDLQDSIDNNTTYSVATTSADGLMSSTDKSKLDGVATGADVTPSWVPDSDPSYLTSYTETDTLSSVVSRGASTTTTINSGDILPSADSTYDIGSNANKFAEGHFDHLYIGETANNPRIDIYTENATASIADTFADTTTDKSYIYFQAGTNSNDPGYIMHETSENASPDERNEGVLHLVPSDDNSTGDYVSIHGTNDADVLKLHTSGLIETATGYQLVLKSGNAATKVDDTLHVTGRLYVDTLDANTSSTSALVEGASGEIEKRTLGSNAFTSTTIPTGTAASKAVTDFVQDFGTTSQSSINTIAVTSGKYRWNNQTEGRPAASQDNEYGTLLHLNYDGTNATQLAHDIDQNNLWIRHLNTTSDTGSSWKQIADTGYVDAAVAGLVDSAPATLDTLNELAAALGDDASFSTTMSTALGNRLRVDTASQGLTSTQKSNARTNLGLGTAATSAATDFVAVSGDTMTGDLTSSGVITSDVLRLTNDATDTFRHRMAVYDSSGGVSYGMMLWNTNGVNGDWSTMIYGPNQSNRRISFGKVNTTTPTNHSHVSEIAYFDLDDSSLNLTGELKAVAKSFDIEHPTKEGKRLVYGSLEGAEHGVYFRGKGTGEVIELPEHWTGLVHEDSITVQLTPIGKNCVWVEDIKDNAVHVGMDNDTPYFYFIQGERKDIDKLIVEQDA